MRDNLDTKDAMLTNSLFLDFLIANGLKVWNGKSTRDVICVEFGYGSRSLDGELRHLESMLRNTEADDEARRERIENLIAEAKANGDKYDKQSKDDLRTLFYRDGVSVTYKTYNKDGKVIKAETIHYKMLYRTPGKAKKGTVMFICNRLYKKARDFLYMGIKLPKENAPIVEMGAYSSLITSSIIGRVKILPEEILVVKDVESFMTTNVVSIETNDRNECVAVRRNDYELKNTMFDGQALIDTSIFPTWADGYVLLRHHMMKAAAFHANIQKYFRDTFCQDYDTKVLTDMWGGEHLAKDIKLITTENAMKWMKFGVSYDYWSEWVNKNGALFGIVKTAHPSKLGDVQKMSYQMVNSLDIDSMDAVMAKSDEYLRRLQTDDDELLAYMEQHKNFSNDFEVLIALVKQDREFLQSEYFRERKRKIINTYALNMRSGKLIQNADNLTIVGSPYAMLMYAAGLDPGDDPTFQHEEGCIQCWTSRFRDGEYLAEFRNPFNGRSNMGHLHNHYHPFFSDYFNFCPQIIAINMLHTDFQDRNNGLTYWASVQKCA